MKYKKDIIERLGGEAQYELTIVDFSERLMGDPLLSDFYVKFSLENLCVLQRNVLDLALAEVEDEEEHIKACQRVLLDHTPFIMVGFNGSHFDRIKAHLHEALNHFWLGADVIEDIEQNFDSLRSGFFGTAWLNIHPTKYTKRLELNWFDVSSSSDASEETSSNEVLSELIPTKRPSGDTLLALYRASKRAKADTENAASFR